MRKIVFVFMSIVILLMTPELSPLYGAGPQLPEFSLVVKGQRFESIGAYITKFMKYPEGTDGFGILGTIVIEFTVNTSGELSEFQVINSVTSAMDQEVIRVLQETSGAWVPGWMNGKPAQMKREVSVVLKPNDNYNLDDIASKSQVKGDEQLLVEKNPKKALRYYDRAVSLLPYQQDFLAARSLCKYELGDEEGAREDWNRIIYLNKYNSDVFHFSASNLNPSMKQLSGYAKLSSLL